MGDFAEGLPEPGSLGSRPLAGKRFGIIRETTGEGVSPGVSDAFAKATRHLENLGADVEEVRLACCSPSLSRSRLVLRIHLAPYKSPRDHHTLKF